MKFKHTQPCTRSNKGERTIRPRRYIGQLARTVAGDAIAALDMGDEIHFLGHNRQSRREAPATADSGIVERAEGGSSAATAACRKIGNTHGKITARIDAIPEIAEDSDHFVVPPSRIESRFHQEVGSPIEGVSGAIKGVVQTTGGTGSVDEEVCREAATTNGGLWPFNRGTYGKLAEILDHAEAVGALPGPAHDILGVDQDRKSTRLNSSHSSISYAVFCLKKKKSKKT